MVVFGYEFTDCAFSGIINPNRPIFVCMECGVDVHLADRSIVDEPCPICEKNTG